MATLFTHAALPILIGRSFVPAGQSRGRFVIAATICACAPDLDFLGYGLDVGSSPLWGHRGVTHSIPFAAVLAAVVAAGFFPALLQKPRLLGRVWLALFAWGASHGLIDALTFGGPGVALFAPFGSSRFHLPLHLVAVTPLGIDEALGRWGVLVVINELLLLVFPALLISWLLRRLLGSTRPVNALRWGVASIAWLGIVVALRVQLPEHFGPPQGRELKSFGPPASEEHPSKIPLDGLPDGRLVTRLEELKALGLFDADLVPAAQPWSSSFFPSWYGGIAGRWQDDKLTLIGRTLTGVTPLSQDDAAQLHERGQTLRLSPLEKLDLAMGDLTLPATRNGLTQTHNRIPPPRFWFGLCNGVAIAGVKWPEPHRTVDAISPNGRRVRFLPTDVKGLLGMGYTWMNDTVELGGDCDEVSLDSSRVCSMNPGGLVLATLNRVGLARTTFLVDVHPTRQSQHYAVARARVSLLGTPYPYDGRATTPRLKALIAKLADVEIRFDVSSTTLSYEAGNARASSTDDTRYLRVGLQPVPFVWSATLALDEAGAIVGGGWSGDPPDGPDMLTFVAGGPYLTDAGTLEINKSIRWDVVEALATASTDSEATSPTVDLRVLLDAGR